MMDRLAAAVVLTKELPWAWRLLLVSSSPQVSYQCLERVLSKEAWLIPSGEIQQQLGNNCLSGQCT